MDLPGGVKEDSAAAMKYPPLGASAFASDSTELLVSEKKYTVRVLQMTGSTMVFISAASSEVLDEMAVGMPMPSDGTVLSTTVLGPHVLSDSQRLAEKLSKRFKRQFFVSNNAPVDRMSGPLLEHKICDYLSRQAAVAS